MLDVLIVDDSAAIRKILLRVLPQAEIPIGSVFDAGDGGGSSRAFSFPRF